MKIAIYGAGAVGSVFGGLLARAGADVTLVGRGAHFDAMARDGLGVQIGDAAPFAVRPRCVADPAAAGVQDYVVMTVKGHAVPDAAERIAPMLGPQTAVVAAQNGIPWWYFHKAGGRWDGHRLRTVDPDGRAWRLIGPERAIGAVVSASCEVEAPGHVHNLGTRNLTLGEADGAISDRCLALSQILEAAGATAPVVPNIRDPLWSKLWGNISFSQIAVLTGSTLGPLIADPVLQAFGRRIMEDTEAVGRAIGVRFIGTIDERIAITAKNGAHKTSILVDLERGRRLEIDAQVGAVIEIARMAGVPTPTVDLLYALVRLRAINSGCYPADAPLPA